MRLPKVLKPLAGGVLSVCFALSSVFASAQDRGDAVPPPPGGVTATISPDPVLTDEQLQNAWRRALDRDTKCRTPVETFKKPIIVVDLGHGYLTARGKIESGAQNKKSGLKEVDIIDAVGGKLHEVLKEKGFDAVLTRQPGEGLHQAQGNHGLSLSVRGHLPVTLAQETGRPVVLVSIHVDSMRDGGVAYVHNSEVGIADEDSKDLARTIAASYKIGTKDSRTNADRDWNKGGWRFNKSILRNYERSSQRCDGVEGGAILLELGSLNNRSDIEYLQKWKDKEPDGAADQIASGIGTFVKEKYGWTPPQPETNPADIIDEQMNARFNGPVS